MTYLPPNWHEQRAANRRRKRYFVAAISLLIILSILLISSCQKEPLSSNSTGCAGASNYNDSLRVVLKFKSAALGDSLYYSINLPCLAPNQKTGYSRDSIKSWQCKGSPNGAFYVVSAQASGSLLAPDSLSLEVYVNGSLKISGKSINTIAASFQF